MTQPSFGIVAPTSRRAVAYIIDALIAGGIGIVLGIVLAVIAVAAGQDGMLGVLLIGAPVIWVVLLGWFVFYTFMQAGNGSIGMRAQGLRLVRDADGGPLGFGKTLLRNIIFGLSAAIVVGYFTPLFDGSGRFQGWHDKVARSLMLDARADRASAAPATTAVGVPPRPQVPGLPPQGLQSQGLGVPGLGAPAAVTPGFPVTVRDSPQWPGGPALDETVRPPAPGFAFPDAPAADPAAPTVVPAAFSSPADTASPADSASPAGDSLIAFVPGITQDGPVAVPEPAPAVASAPADDVFDIEDTRISVPGHRLVFTWDDGTRVTVSSRTLFGRNPAPEDGAAVVSVRDETLSLSKTHFEAAAEASGGWIRDRHSTNGTVIVRDGQRIACAAGEQVRIRLGDAIEIGDRIVTVGGYA